MSPMPSTANKAGFTLMELLIAISIFGIVIGVAYSSYNSSFTIITRASSQAVIYAKAKTTMERILTDLESLYIGSDMPFEGRTDDINGHRADDLKFISTAYVKLHPDDQSPGQLVIHYEAEEHPDSGSLLLYRSQYPPYADEDQIKSSRLLLCDNLQEIAFDYLDDDANDSRNWGKEESEDNEETLQLPSLISITLRFSDGREDTPGTLFQSAVTLPMANH